MANIVFSYTNFEVISFGKNITDVTQIHIFFLKQHIMAPEKIVSDR